MHVCRFSCVGKSDHISPSAHLWGTCPGGSRHISKKPIPLNDLTTESPPNWPVTEITNTSMPFCGVSSDQIYCLSFFFFFLLHRKLTLTPYNQFSERTEDFWRLSFIWALNSLKHGDSLLWLRWAQCPGIQERMETVNILFVSQMTHHRRLFWKLTGFFPSPVRHQCSILWTQNAEKRQVCWDRFRSSHQRNVPFV